MDYTESQLQFRERDLRTNGPVYEHDSQGKHLRHAAGTPGAKAWHEAHWGMTEVEAAAALAAVWICPECNYTGEPRDHNLHAQVGEAVPLTLASLRGEIEPQPEPEPPEEPAPTDPSTPTDEEDENEEEPSS